MDFPKDENGDVLRLMVKNGDDLSKPRMMDFVFIFPERRQALAFADLVDERNLSVTISYNERRDMWDVNVHKHMIPTYKDITEFESEMTIRAESVGGEADSWGSFAQTRA